MDRIIRYTAYFTNILLVFGALFLVTQAYTVTEILIALFLFVPPILSIIALYTGPDLEERKLLRQLHKTRLRIELKNLYASSPRK